MNFSIFKRDTNKNVLTDDNLDKDEVFNIKDLYVTTLGKVEIIDGIFDYSYDFEPSNNPNDIIIVKRVHHNRKVQNVLNNLEYFHFYSIRGYMYKYKGCYMAGELKPLSMVLENKTKTHISKRELLRIFYPESEISFTSEIKDIVLKQIKETDNKINRSNLTEKEKKNLKNKLVEVARNYVDILKSMSNSSSKVISLNVNHESIINLRKEVMRKLVEIEMELPPEYIDNISNELMLLEQEIVKSK